MKKPADLPEIQFQYRMGWNTAKGAQRLYRNDELGLQMEIHTPKEKGIWGKQKNFYYIDGDKTEWTDPIEFTKEVIKRGLIKNEKPKGETNDNRNN